MLTQHDDSTYELSIYVFSFPRQPLCAAEGDKIPLLIYERYYFWSLHFLFEKSKIKRQKIHVSSDFSLTYCIEKHAIYDDVQMYTSIYNSAYNKQEENKTNPFNKCELVENDEESGNKELTIYNNDYIKYLYLNGIKNNENNFVEQSSYPNNEIKWYRLKIKIESVGKKKKNSYFSYGANSFNAIHFKEQTTPSPYSKNACNGVSQLDRLNCEKARKSLKNLMKMQKRKFIACGRESIRERSGREQGGKEKGGKEQSGKENGGREQSGKENGGREQSGKEKGGKEQSGRGSTRNRLFGEASNDERNVSCKEEREASFPLGGGHSARRKKRKNWYYCKSSSNDMTYDEDNFTNTRENSIFTVSEENTCNKNKKRKSKNYNGNVCGSSMASSRSESDSGSTIGSDSGNSRNDCNGRRRSVTPASPNGKQCQMKKSPICTYPISKKKHTSKCKTFTDRANKSVLKFKDLASTMQISPENRNKVETARLDSGGDVTDETKAKLSGKAKRNNSAWDKKERGRGGRTRRGYTPKMGSSEIIEKTDILIESSRLFKIDTEEHITSFNKMFLQESEESVKKKKQNNQNDIDMYINKILKNILNKKKSHLNSISKNFERIETFYKQNYKIYIIDDKEPINDKRDFFKNDNNMYILFDEWDSSHGQDVDIWEFFKRFMRGEPLSGKKEIEKDLSSYPMSCIRREKVQADTQIPTFCTEKKEHYNGSDVVDVGGVGGVGDGRDAHEGEAPEGGATDAPSPLADNSTEHVTNGTIFLAKNKKDEHRERLLEEGDIVYVKFSDSYDDYDKVRILKKQNVIYILIYLLKNEKNINLSSISTYAPDLLWNISLHFKRSSFDLEICLEKVYKYVTSGGRREHLIDVDPFGKHVNEQCGDERCGDEHSGDERCGDEHCGNERCGDERCGDEQCGDCHFDDDLYGKNRNEKKIAKRAYQKEMEIMKLKDNVAFIDKYLQNVNDRKIKKLKNAQKEYYVKYEYDRTINRLTKQQLIDLFIDKENEINIIPLSYLKEKSRNIIYEENIKMNMFACINVIFDDVKGRCIYAASDLNKFDFVFEYVGELLTHNEAMKREQKYIKNKKKGCYMFYFKHESKRYCIDGTEESIDAAINNNDKKYFLRSFARLVNHSKKNSNLIPKVLTVSNLPRLFFVASRDIKEGEELLIDYGERDREIIKSNEWLKC
ncbi:SET domain protein, putative [Plasmodium ovale curtisi]|uniref:SET domain protein, putative n=1 Tax=Plasmodium ovale curtisi TaxID=864141 RepID=A0A1A8VIA5_PLAOA|nr:SET domain protein, putative [Plasmodium ovale curtisi]